MISNETSSSFVNNWMNAFNSHDISRILEHYDDEIEFYSPFIQLLQFNDKGVITSKKLLQQYFEAGLRAYPDLHFKLHDYFTGVNTVVVVYTSVNGSIAAETFELNKESKAVKVFCSYKAS